ncbi:MAG: cobalt-precorrin-6A synthase [Syntrophaceae bacterium PtaU1.Bin231]|nr:MAG: cobalt-precorrin-6A synthase [Syntrophaceae bacterium PtaU1.Bin231]
MSASRSGLTTGTCAAAAAKAAVAVLLGGNAPAAVEIRLPAGERISVPVLSTVKKGGGVEAAVVKDAGDDPDITSGVTVKAFVEWCADDISFCAGNGVGTVTKPGLSVEPGEPAINPVPRRMIARSVRELTDRGVRVTLSIPGGRELGERTFNPRLGIRDGLSILGTSGRVRPFSCPALRASLWCCLEVLAAASVKFPVLVPGHIGERAAKRHFSVAEDQLLEVSNEWGYVLDQAAPLGFSGILILGHPGKLAKLAAGDWDTHSSRSKSALPFVARLAAEDLGRDFSDVPTVEGIFTSLPAIQKEKLGNLIAGRIRKAVADRLGGEATATVVLVDMKGDILGVAGDISPWRR